VITAYSHSLYQRSTDILDFEKATKIAEGMDISFKQNRVGSKRSIKELFALFMLGGLLGHQLCAIVLGLHHNLENPLFPGVHPDFENATKTASQIIEREPTRNKDTMIPSPASGMNQQTRIAYISQGRANAYIDLKKRFEQVVDNETSAFFFHSFDKNCNGCAFQANTTLAMGRNIGLKEAIKQLKVMGHF
jgi:hypothetical protein